MTSELCLSKMDLPVRWLTIIQQLANWSILVCQLETNRNYSNEWKILITCPDSNSTDIHNCQIVNVTQIWKPNPIQHGFIPHRTRQKNSPRVNSIQLLVNKNTLSIRNSSNIDNVKPHENWYRKPIAASKVQSIRRY